jgi:hypothetical protein
MAQIRAKQHVLIWRYFRDPDDLLARRLLALGRFLADYDAGKAARRYVTASLPKLPFATGEFDLAVVCQFLFLYSDKFQYHEEAVDELLRVAKEVRIFPIVTLEGELSPHFNPIDSRLKALGFQCERRRVDYEFVPGANEVYIVRREPLADDGRRRWARGDGDAGERTKPQQADIATSAQVPLS